jgi:hypothetical protein
MNQSINSVAHVGGSITAKIEFFRRFRSTEMQRLGLQPIYTCCARSTHGKQATTDINLSSLIECGEIKLRAAGTAVDMSDFKVFKKRYGFSLCMSLDFEK